MNVFESFTEAYQSLMRDVYENPEYECAPRGSKIKESLCTQFRITNPLDRIPYVNAREFSISYMIAELVWYLFGDNSTEWISRYSAFWSKISDDGYSANSAYGSRIFRPHKYSTDGLGWTQWDYILNELTSDNDSRRAVIHIRSPYDSIHAKLDVPCTLTLQFFIRDDKLNLAVNMRSSDLILGLAYDVPAFTMFQETMAQDLSKKLGRHIGMGDYIHTSNSLHIYEKHFDMAERIISESVILPSDHTMPGLPDTNGVPLVRMVEGSITSCEVASEIERVIDSSPLREEVDSYWLDWMYVLGSHRARKLGDDREARRLLEQCEFSGYKFFNK